MKTISREELKQKLDHKKNFRLVMALAVNEVGTFDSSSL